MTTLLLVVLDKAFFAFHALWIGFNMVGWAWKRTRPPHRITVGLTAFSWFVLGAYYGWGYCLCTDWHFQVRKRLGYHDPETSYIQHLLKRVLGISLTRSSSNLLAMGVFALIVILTIVLAIGDFRARRSKLNAGVSADRF